MAIKLILDCTQGVAQYFKINGVSVNYNYWEVNEFTIEEDSVLTFQAYKGTTMVINGEDVPVYNVIERTIDASNLKEITIVMGEGSSIYTDVALNITNVKPPITDLTGYTWVGNETLDLSTMVNSFTPRKTFNVNAKRNTSDGTDEFNDLWFTFVEKFKIYGLGAGEYTLYDMSGWANYPSSATIKFTGGTDVTNAELISWLEANGTLKEPILQLAPFLTSIANAIRFMKETTKAVNAQDFASEIEHFKPKKWVDKNGYSGTLKFWIIGNVGADVYVYNTYRQLLNIHSGVIANEQIFDISNAIIIFINVMDTASGIRELTETNFEWIVSDRTAHYRTYRPSAENFSLVMELTERTS